MEQALSSVMRNIVDAQWLDNEGRDKEAYIRYLESILGIASNLLQSVRDAGGSILITKEIQRQVHLAQQCVERVCVLVDIIASGQLTAVMISPGVQIPDRAKPVQSKSFITVPPLSPEPTANTFSRVKYKTPMEIAYQRNQQLMTAYRARLTRMNTRDPGAASLSLTLQRKMAENLAIAKKQEMALAKKMQERQERLEAEAAKRFTAPIGMSEEELEQRQIYKKILDYEQDAKWLQEWRTKLEHSSQEPEVICRLIQDILRCTDHPLTLMLKRYREKIYEKLYPLVVNKRQKLSAITVPLSESLWSPELCHSSSSIDQTDIVKDENVLSDVKTPTCDVLSPDCEKQRSKEARQYGSGDVQENWDETSALYYTVGNGNVCSQSSLERSYMDTEEKALSDEKNQDEMEQKVDRDLSCWGKKSQTVHKIGADDKDAGESESSVKEDSVPQTCCPEEQHGSPSHEKSCVSEKNESMAANSNTNSSSKVEVETLHINSETKMKKLREINEKEQMINDVSEKLDGVKSLSDSCTGGSSEEDLSSPHVEEASSFARTLPEAVQENKDDLSIAALKTKKLSGQLAEEQERIARILHQVTQDYEKYNEENMDDLFDDVDEESECGDCQPSLPTSLPESDQNVITVSQANVSQDGMVPRSLSGSVQDFPSLPSVDDESAEIEMLSRAAYERHLKNISADVHMYMEKMLVLFTIAYEHLDSPLGRDQCYASLEEMFFKPLWKFLLMLFRLVHYQEELTAAYKMTKMANVTPQHLGVSQKLCLSTSADGTEVGHIQPFQTAIEELIRIKDHYTMLSKLECIVKVVRLIFDNIKDFYQGQGSDEPSVGADDLLPVMSYVVLRSRLPQLVSECHALSEFIHEGYLMGQEGYCLTTLETAVSYIVSSDLQRPSSPI